MNSWTERVWCTWSCRGREIYKSMPRHPCCERWVRHI